MEQKLAYQCDREGYLAGTSECLESPLEPGVWLVPGNATLIEPPKFDSSVQKAFFNFETQAWSIENLAPLVPEEQPEKTPEETWATMNPNQRRMAVIDNLQTRHSNVQTAMQEILWAEWAGGTVDKKAKKAWAEYRKQLNARPLDSEGTKFFKELSSVEAYPYPEEPVMPSSAE